MESVQSLMEISKMQRKIQKIFLVNGIIPSEMAAVNCLYYKENICHGQLMPQEIVLRLFISVREIFLNAIAFTVINNC